jgi:hypothetical protein
MENDKAISRQSIIIVTRKEGDPVINVEAEFIDQAGQAEAHKTAEDWAKKHVGDGVTIEVYRRMLTYEAEIKVTTKRDGE